MKKDAGDGGALVRPSVKTGGGAYLLDYGLDSEGEGQTGAGGFRGPEDRFQP
jgi:hypothetical protein